MTASFTLRPAALGDVPTLAAFQCAMALETEDHTLDEATVTAGIQGLLTHPDRGRVWVAVDEADTCIGTASVTFEWSDWRNGTFWWLQSVYVLPPWRQRGVFSALYQTLREGALTDPTGIGLRLYVERDNARAQRTYAALGMRETDYRLFEEEFPKG
jgi:GNAT superfamily N-acetyltransferase